MRLTLPWCQLLGGRVLVSHFAGSEQGDEVKVSGPESAQMGREEGSSWPCFRQDRCLRSDCMYFSVAGGSVSKKFTSKAAPFVLQ